jgi:hypothetical protein
LPFKVSLPCAASDEYAVRCSKSVSCYFSLPCGLLAAHGNDVFAVQHRTAKALPSRFASLPSDFAARQRSVLL